MADLPGTFGLTRTGEAAKLLIKSFADADRTRDEKAFSCFINPDEYSLNYEVIADTRLAVGDTANAGTFIGSRPLEVNLKFYLDGTNATGKKIEVKDEVTKFNDIVGYNGDEHRTRYLRLIWGNGAWLRPNQFAFDCILKSASFQYKLFNNDGSPLRVIINAVFAEALTATENAAEKRDKSADLTHIRTVKEGDTLPGMSQEIYGDFRYYLEVAKANNLKDFRNLEPGTKIFFPPFDKNIKQKVNA